MWNHLSLAGSKTASLLGRFRRETRGNIAVITALCALPLMIAAGVAIDIARASRSQNALQVAVDSAALAIASSSKSNLAGLSEQQKAARKAELEQMARNFVKGNYRDEGQDPTVTVEITNDNAVVKASKPYPTSLMRLAGFNSVDLGASATVNLRGENLEIVLVMDITGSMKGRPLADAKNAAKALLQKVMGDSKTSANIRLGLVPFSASVNVGADKRSSGWIDTDGKATVSRVNFSDNVYHNMKAWDDLKLAWNGCVEMRLNTAGLDDTVPSAAKPDTLFTPYFAPDEPDKSYYDGLSYNDFINDGVSGDDTARLKYQGKYKNAKPKESLSDYGPAKNCAKSPIVAMTATRADVESGIEAMQANGPTNLVEGMMWAWRVLSPEQPYPNEIGFDNKDWRKIVVFMTDGMNDVGTTNGTPPSATGTVYTAFGYSAAPLAQNRFGTTSQWEARDKVDDAFKKACASLKTMSQPRIRNGIETPSLEIYTVYFKTLYNPKLAETKEMLTNCATTPEHFLDAANGAELLAKFEQIGDRLRSMYLSK